MNIHFKNPFYLRLLIISTLFFILPVGLTAQLNADFTASKNGGCSPLAVSFINQTTGASANAVYSWNFDNGNTAGIFSPGAIFKDERIYNVTLTVKDVNLSSTKTKQITVYSAPVVDFAASSEKGCLPMQVDFTATASGGNAVISGYTWDFGDGNILQQFGASQSHNYTVPQDATVSLTVSNNFGCTKTIVKDQLIKILPSIKAQFSASQTVLCRVTDAVRFTNTSSGPGTLSYLWDFGDGTTSSLATPSHVFNLKGIYTVKLTVSSSEGCSASNVQNGYINVASFSTDFNVPALVCNSNNYVLINSLSSPSPTSSLWSVDGVNQYNNYQSLSAYFPLSGSYNIQLVNYFGTCKDSVSKIVTVKQSPDPKGFTSVIKGDCGAPVVFDFKDTSAGNIKWEWNFQSYYYYDSVFSRLQSPSFEYLSDGSYQVKLKVENAAGCVASTEKTIFITRPYVYINAEGNLNNCGPIELKFKASVSPVTDSLVTYNWSFGDGGISSDIEPMHTFTLPGNHSVTLSYKTKNGCTGLVSYGNVTVYPKPKADFTVSVTNVCGQTPVVFTAVQQTGNFYYIWDLGDGSIQNIYNSTYLTHQYTYDSTYSIRLIVSNFGLCADTLIKNNLIKVNPPFPKISGQTNTCDGNRGIVTFTHASVKANQLIWDFGDGTTLQTDSTQKTIQHQYTQSKQYTVKLTAVNGACSVSESTSAYVHLKQSPLLTLNKTAICNGDIVTVRMNNYDRNPTVDLITQNFSFNYYYGDNTPFNGTVRDDSYYYLWSNEYLGNISNFDKAKSDIRMITRSVYFNCLDTTNFVPLKVKGSDAGFQIITDNLCFKSPVVLKDTSKSNSKILSWQWNFGDGNYQTVNQSSTVSHRYANPGQYNVSLTITDSSGCSSNSNASAQSRYVDVNGPKAAFSASSNNTFITLPVYFYNYTNNYNSYNTQYTWLFGDGTSSADYNPTHSYPLPSTYTVILIAKNPVTNCTDTTSQLIIVNNFNPAFAINTSFLTAGSCPPVLARFSNNSINYTSVKWDFGDGVTADNINYPAHVYEKPGKYLVKLYVYGPGGLTGTYLDSVVIKQAAAALKVDKKLGCIGLIATLSGSIKNATSYTWDFGDGSLVNTKDTLLTHQYNLPGSYAPSLLLTDTNGCNTFTSLNEVIIIRSNPVVTISPAAPILCSRKSVTLAASGGFSYQWTPAKGLSNSLIASPGASPDSSTRYYVTAKDDIGCTNKDSVLVTVVQKNIIKLSADTAICFGKSTQLKASGTDQYKWIFKTNALSDVSIPNPVANPLVNTTFTVTGSDRYQCFSDTASIFVLVLPLPTVNISPVNEVLLGSPVQLSATYSADVVKWTWTPTNYLSCTNCPSPISTPLAAVTYQLLVKNNVGCTDTAQVTLKLQCEESRVFIPTAFSPNNDGNNDRFSIKGISIVRHMIIFNRWGKPVYERNNYIASNNTNGWDGTFKGEPLPAGAYTYFAEMECPTGGVFVRNGTMMLIR